MSHRFGFTSRWSVGPEDKSPFSRRFSIHGFTQISVRPRIRGPRRSRRLRRFFTFPPVPLIGDRNLKGWLRVLTQQSCECLSPNGRLYGYSHVPHTCKKFYHLLNPSSTSCLIRFAISNWPSRTIT